jgi:hypothetical protein
LIGLRQLQSGVHSMPFGDSFPAEKRAQQPLIPSSIEDENQSGDSQ